MNNISTVRDHGVNAVRTRYVVGAALLASVLGFSGTLRAMQARSEDSGCAHSHCYWGQWCKMQAGEYCHFENAWTCETRTCAHT